MILQTYKTKMSSFIPQRPELFSTSDLGSNWGGGWMTELDKLDIRRMYNCPGK